MALISSTWLSLRARLPLLLGAAVLLMVWIGGAWLYERGRQRERTERAIAEATRHAGVQAASLASDLRRNLKILHGIPAALAGDQSIVDALTGDRDAAMRLNQFLARASATLSPELIWVVNAAGDCIAASNFDQPDSLVGTNFAARDFFISARRGEEGRQFAIGQMTQLGGLNFSAPVQVNGKFAGAVVMRLATSSLVYLIEPGGAFVVDGNGVVILARDKTLEMKALPDGAVYGMSPQLWQETYRRRNFSPLQISAWPDARYPELRRFEHSPEPTVFGQASLPELELQVLVAEPVPAIAALDHEFQRLFFLLSITGFAVLLAATGSLMYLQDSRATRRRLREQRDQLNNAQELAHVGSWEYDLRLRQSTWSEENFRIHGLAPQAVAPNQRDYLKLIHPDDRERVTRESRRGLEQGQGYHLEYRIVRPGGEVRHVIADASLIRDQQGQPIKLSGSLKDDTEHLQILSALRASEARLRRLMNSSLIGIMHGDLGGRLLDVNQAFLQLTGYDRTALLRGGVAWKDLTPAEFQHMDQKALDELREHGVAVPFEKELIGQGQRRIPVLMGMALLENSQNEWVGFVLDLTERHRADRIQSEFISVVSHELRTPVTSIRGALGLLEAGIGGALPDQAMQLVKIAHRNSQRLVGLVNDILDMEKLMANKMAFNFQTVDLVRLLGQSLEANAAYAEDLHVKLVFSEHPEHAAMRGDPDRLMQVMANLLSNAAKFSPPGDQVEVRLRLDGSSWRIEVSDRGPGIPRAFRRRIFRAFAQADNTNTRQKGGTGLGLHISRTMVERMGGQIGFESEEGRGTTFWITFPVIA